MTTARHRRPPLTLPAMTAIEMPFEAEPEVEPAEVELACDCKLVVEGADWEDPGGDCVEVGNEPVRQVLSPETPTILISELPP